MGNLAGKKSQKSSSYNLKGSSTLQKDSKGHTVSPHIIKINLASIQYSNSHKN